MTLPKQPEPASTDPPKQVLVLTEYETLLDRRPSQIVSYFKSHPEDAEAVLFQSYDKRCSPSAFVVEEGKSYRVGWFDSEAKSVQVFRTLAEAVTDYLLLTYGRKRLDARRRKTPKPRATVAADRSKADGTTTRVLRRPHKQCDECGSYYYSDTSKMDSMCPECAHHIYGYENCRHSFRGMYCRKCGWDGARSKYVESLIACSRGPHT